MNQTQSSIVIRQICEVGCSLFDKKNRAYGNAIEKTGVLGACVEIIGAAARLPIMVVKSIDHGRSVRKKLFDVLLDIHNYSAIAILMMKDNNWEGN